MLTLKGYQVSKKDIKNIDELRRILTAKPYIPSVFVKPQYVQKYPVYVETSEYIYVPKHYGLLTYGQVKEREVSKTDIKYWKFTGTLRPIQQEVVSSYSKDGIISLQTGGGKTVCALYIASTLQLPTVVLVHNTFLRDQWIERIKNFLPNARIGSLQGTTIDVENKDIIVAMLQSVSMKEYSDNLFENIGFLIVDECHHIASESFSKAIPKLTCKHMLGLSATPERKDKLMYVINWFLGPLLYKSDTLDKVDEKVKVEVYEFEPENSDFNEIIYNSQGVMFTSLMINKVVDYQPRNKMLVDILTDIYSEKSRQILVLTDRVDHAKTILNMLSPEIKEETCILGREVKSDQRAIWCSTKRILIATYTMCKEGFDVSTLNTLLMATSRPDVDQIVGRILRTDKIGRKINPLIIDIVDPAFRRQFQTRLSLYKSRAYEIEKMTI